MISKYSWNFKKIYPSIKNWEQDFNSIDIVCNKIIALKNKLNLKDNFLNYLDLSEKLDKILEKLGFYLHLGDLNLSDPIYLDLINKFEIKIQEISLKLNFVEFEIKKIDSKIIYEWLNSNPNYKRFIFDYQEFFRLQKHELEKETQKLLLKVSLSRGSVFSLYDCLAFSDNSYQKIEYKSKLQELDLNLYQKILQESNPKKDQELRIKAGYKFNYHLINNKNTFAKIYQNILTYNIEQIKLKKFANILDYFLISDNVPSKIYLDLIKVSKKYQYLFKDFVTLIQKDLKLSKIYRSDLNLNNYKLNQKITIPNALDIIKKALAPLGKHYLANLKIAYENNSIDYFANSKKRSGAYSSCIYEFNPIILLNYDYSIQSINTLAHELGHSVHSLFSNQNQPYNLASYPIILAEIASTLNEHLLFDYLFQNASSKKEKIYILKNRINDIFNTFFRQVQFADFELKAHQLVKNKENLNCEVLANLFLKTCNEHGYNNFSKYPSEYKNLKYSWVRISHFFHSPFYVYKYAFAISASFYFYQQIKANNTTSYIKFLKSGNYKQPLDILKDLKINVNSNLFYNPLIEELKNLINLLKNLLKK